MKFFGDHHEKHYRLEYREQVLRFIVQYKTAHDGNSPTVREIAKGCGAMAFSTANRILRELDECGYISLKGSSRIRSIEVTGGRWAFEGENDGGGMA